MSDIICKWTHLFTYELLYGDHLCLQLDEAFTQMYLFLLLILLIYTNWTNCRKVTVPETEETILDYAVFDKSTPVVNENFSFILIEHLILSSQLNIRFTSITNIIHHLFRVS